jgi:hypothetical protein
VRDGGLDCGGLLGLLATLGDCSLLADADPSSDATSLPVLMEDDREKGAPADVSMPSSTEFDGSAAATAFGPRFDAIVHCPPVCIVRISRPGGGFVRDSIER